jgi:hypothetical protein
MNKFKTYLVLLRVNENILILKYLYLLSIKLNIYMI